MSKKSKQLKRVQRRGEKRIAKDMRMREYQAKIIHGSNSKRKDIAARKGLGKMVADHKNPAPSFYVYIKPNRYGELHA